MTMNDATHRKYNDGSHNSSTYHKKDGTNVRAILKELLRKEVLVYQHGQRGAR